MATPVVTGAAALVKHEYPELDITRLRNILYQSTTDIMESGYDKYSGAGMIHYSGLLAAPSPDAAEWLNAKEGQPHSSGNLTLALSQSLMGGTLSIYNNEERIIQKEIDSSSVSFPIESQSNKSKTKLMVIAAKDQIVLDVSTLYLTNPSFSESAFKDVTGEYWAFEEIMNTVNFGYIHGYDDGSFKPDQNISRRHATMMLNRLFRWESLDSTKSAFNDVKEELDSSFIAMMSANEEGVIKGYDTGHFYPERPLSRGQMALVLSRALKLDSQPLTDDPYPFKDVAKGKEIYTPVTNLAEAGIITKQEYYNPAEPINRAQFAAMINRTHQYLQNQSR
jgi:hypothetical protein